MSKCNEGDMISAFADQESLPDGARQMRHAEITTPEQRPKGKAVSRVKAVEVSMQRMGNKVVPRSQASFA